MAKFLHIIKQQLNQFVEHGYNKPVDLKQNQLINTIYSAINDKSLVLISSDQNTYKGRINRYDKDRQAVFIDHDKIITMISLTDIKRIKPLDS